MFRLQNYIISFLSFINAKTLVNSFILLERERERERESTSNFSFLFVIIF